MRIGCIFNLHGAALPVQYHSAVFTAQVRIMVVQDLQ